MNTIIFVLMLFGYLVGAFFLLISAVAGIVSTKKTKALAYSLALFVLVPWSLMWAKVIIPLVGLTVMGYGVICFGMFVRTQLFRWRDQLLEEIRKNLTEDSKTENSPVENDPSLQENVK